MKPTLLFVPIFLAFDVTHAFSITLKNGEKSLRRSKLVLLDMPPQSAPALERIAPMSDIASLRSQAWNSNISSFLIAETKSTNIASGSGISIADVHYDGAVPKTEADEYVVIRNTSNNAVDISGYFVYVATTGSQGPTFFFPKGTVLKPSSSVRIYTNEIHKETGGFSYGSGKAIWSNNGGLAVLKGK